MPKSSALIPPAANLIEHPATFSTSAAVSDSKTLIFNECINRRSICAGMIIYISIRARPRML